MLCASITTMHHFSIAPINGVHYFCVARQYPPCTILVITLILVAHNFFYVSHANIPHIFHSTCYIIPKSSKPPMRTNTLRASLTKLSCDNINPHCMHTNKISLRSTNTVHTTCAIIMCVHTAHNLLCVCTPRTSIMHASLNLHHRMLNLACNSHANIFLHNAKF
jgi:hypothetical protein